MGPRVSPGIPEHRPLFCFPGASFLLPSPEFKADPEGQVPASPHWGFLTVVRTGFLGFSLLFLFVSTLGM